MTDDLCPRSRQLLAEADEIIVMAKNLHMYGLHAEAVTFVRAANERIRAIHALEARRAVAKD